MIGRDEVERNKVKLTICGTDYNILSDDSEQYMTDLGKQVDKRICETIKGNSRLSTTMAAILVSLEFCDLARKYECKLEALKNRQNKESQKNVLEKIAFDRANDKIESMEKEIKTLREKFSLISKENSDLVQQISEQELALQDFEKQKESRAEDSSNGEDILNFFDFQQFTNEQQE